VVCYLVAGADAIIVFCERPVLDAVGRGDAGAAEAGDGIQDVRGGELAGVVALLPISIRIW
jgi:hypothetical protein